jgi:isochorismate synthase
MLATLDRLAADAAARLRLAVDQAAQKSEALHRSILSWSTVRIPNVDLIDLFDRSARVTDEQWLWVRPQDRFGLLGAGAAWSWEATGPDRFAQASAALQSCLDEAVGDSAAPGPVAMGGFSFAPEQPSGPEWTGFPAGVLVVPGLQVRTTGDESWLTLATMVGPQGWTVEDDQRIAALLTCALAGSSGAIADPRPHREAAAHDGVLPLKAEELLPSSHWKAAVGEAVRAVRRGAFRKIVLARAVRVRIVRPEPGAVLRRLRAEYPGCTIFAVSRGGRCFLGATPEQLVQVRGEQVHTSAVAGSAPRGATEDEDRRLGEMLRSNTKDRIEHAIVVEALREVLSDVCDDLSVADAPELLRVSNVQHLFTPIQGRLRDRLNILQLVERLHPTPAVGGVPQQAALRWIREHEGLERGWYAGPVGWIDGNGEGEFAVAIRSAMLHDGEALLYAGCGIVADSDPDPEYAESALKLRPLLSALGANGAGR